MTSDEIHFSCRVGVDRKLRRDVGDREIRGTVGLLRSDEAGGLGCTEQNERVRVKRASEHLGMSHRTYH